MTRQAGVMQEHDTNGCREIPKRRWVFVHDNDPVVIDEQEVRGSCFFRDYVMGKLECRRLAPYATATESNDPTTAIDRLRELRNRKSARIAKINQKPGDLALEWVRLRLETEIRFCNDQIARVSRSLPIDPEPHEIAKQAWSERERVRRSEALLQIADELREVQALIAKFHSETVEPLDDARKLEIRGLYGRDRFLRARLIQEAVADALRERMVASSTD